MGSFIVTEEAIRNMIAEAGNSSGILSRTVQLTNEQLLGALTPVEIVPAPGAGKVLMFQFAILDFNLTEGYGNRPSELQILLSLTSYVVSRFGNSVLANNTRNIIQMIPDYDNNLLWPPEVQNTGLYFALSDESQGAMTDGNVANVLTIKVFYTVMDL